MRFYCAPALASASDVEVIDSSSCVGGYALKPRYDLATEYGPAQVALALIADAMDDQKAIAHYKTFCKRVMLPLQNREWEISQEDVKQAILDIEQAQPHGVSVKRKAGRRL